MGQFLVYFSIQKLGSGAALRQGDIACGRAGWLSERAEKEQVSGNVRGRPFIVIIIIREEGIMARQEKSNFTMIPTMIERQSFPSVSCHSQGFPFVFSSQPYYRVEWWTGLGYNYCA